MLKRSSFRMVVVLICIGTAVVIRATQSGEAQVQDAFDYSNCVPGGANCTSCLTVMIPDPTCGVNGVGAYACGLYGGSDQTNYQQCSYTTASYKSCYNTGGKVATCTGGTFWYCKAVGGKSCAQWSGNDWDCSSMICQGVTCTGDGDKQGVNWDESNSCVNY